MTYFFDAFDDLELGGGVKIETFFAQEQAKIFGDLSTGNVVAHDRMRQREALEYGHGMCDTVTRVEHYARSATRRV